METVARNSVVSNGFRLVGSIDARLKKRPRSFMSRWWPGKASVCDTWEADARMKSALGVFWPTHA